MKARQYYFFWFCLVYSCGNLLAQNNSDQRDLIIEERIEFMLDETEEGIETDYTELFEQLLYYYENPINLNNTSAEVLRELNLLNDFQINNLLNHIKRNGRLLLYEELQSIEGFTLNVIKRIEPFTRVSDAQHRSVFNLNTLKKEGKSELFLRASRTLELKEGYSPIEKKELEENPNRRYLGDPYHGYSRYRYKY